MREATILTVPDLSETALFVHERLILAGLLKGRRGEFSSHIAIAAALLYRRAAEEPGAH
jgi:hypothetical protein